MTNTYELSEKKHEELSKEFSWNGINQGTLTFAYLTIEDKAPFLEINILDDIVVINNQRDNRRYVLDIDRNSFLSLAKHDNREKAFETILEEYTVPVTGSKLDLYAWSKPRWFNDLSELRESPELVSSGKDVMALIGLLDKELDKADKPINVGMKYKAYRAVVKHTAQDNELYQITKGELQLAMKLGREFAPEVKIWATAIEDLFTMLDEKNLVEDLLN